MPGSYHGKDGRPGGPGGAKCASGIGKGAGGKG